MSGVRTSQSDASSDMDLARAPPRTARKKGSGYENGDIHNHHLRGGAQFNDSIKYYMQGILIFN